MRTVVLTDLDGTLLDAHTYDWSPAKPALAELRGRGIPLVLCTSKTRAEVEALRRDLDHRDPFSVENGAALYVPVGYFGDGVGVRGDGFDIIEMGIRRQSLVACLEAAAKEAGVVVRGWHAMDVDEVARRCEFSHEQARLAMARDYGEPFVIDDPQPDTVARLDREIQRRGARLTRGDRFFHLLGPHDKGAATRHVVALYERLWGAVTTIIVGDALNDVPMLALADTAIVIASPHSSAVAARIPGAYLTTQPGPAGWNTAMLAALAEPAKAGTAPQAG